MSSALRRLERQRNRNKTYTVVWHKGYCAEVQRKYMPEEIAFVEESYFELPKEKEFGVIASGLSKAQGLQLVKDLSGFWDGAFITLFPEPFKGESDIIKYFTGMYDNLIDACGLDEVKRLTLESGVNISKDVDELLKDSITVVTVA